MSQYPPTPPMPPMQPPMQPNYGQGGMPMQPTRTSGAAIGSLICGILGCFLITPFIAVILGFVGISKTKDPRYTGRAIAIIGMILGMLWIIGFLAGGGGIYTFYVASKPVAQVAHQFTADIAGGNMASARSACEANVTDAELQELSTLVQSWGAFQDLTLPARKVDNSNGATTWDLQGIASFNGTKKKARIQLHKQGDGTRAIAFECSALVRVARLVLIV